MNRNLAYIVSRFPKISETFILYEIIELRRIGFEVDVFPLIREHEAVQHPEVETLTARTHYQAIFSRDVILSQFYWVAKQPGRYFSTLWDVVRGNIRSPKFLIRGLAAFLMAGAQSRQVQRAGIGHIHAHWATHPTLAAYVIHRFTGLPYSFTAHAHDIYVDQTMLREKITASKFVVTISEFNRRFLKDLYGEDLCRKVDVIHCGIDLDVFRPRRTTRTSDVFTLICVASLEEKKGHKYLIDACKQLRDSGVAFKCLLIGDGELRSELEATIQQHDLSEHLILLGRQPRQQVGELLAQSQAMILPSIIASHGKMEGIPVALMEAMSTEIPVIATDISGVSELVENQVSGLLVPERDAAALADAIRRLQQSPGLALELGRCGRQKVEQEFDLHRNTERLAQRFLESVPN